MECLLVSGQLKMTQRHYLAAPDWQSALKIKGLGPVAHHGFNSPLQANRQAHQNSRVMRFAEVKEETAQRSGDT